MALGFCIAATVPSGTPWSIASLMAITAACTEDERQDGEELASYEFWGLLFVRFNQTMLYLIVLHLILLIYSSTFAFLFLSYSCLTLVPLMSVR